MKRWSFLVVIVSVLSLFAHSASAQVLSGIAEFTGYGGITINGNDDATAGAALTLNLTPQIGAEGEVGYIFSDDEVITANLNLVLNLGTGASLLVPYLTGGAGVLNNGGTDIALNGGAGIKLFIEPNMALRADFRAFMTSDDGNVHDMERFYGGIDFLF